jgi:hypothetical protein
MLTGKLLPLLLQFLSMKIAASNPVVSFDIVEDFFGRQLKQARNPAASPVMALPAWQLQPSCVQMSPPMQQVHLPASSSGFNPEMIVNSPYPPAPGGPMPVATGGSSAPCLNVSLLEIKRP